VTVLDEFLWVAAALISLHLGVLVYLISRGRRQE
jgi:hypothetical protein